jgi:hypothetical protein
VERPIALAPNPCAHEWRWFLVAHAAPAHDLQPLCDSIIEGRDGDDGGIGLHSDDRQQRQFRRCGEHQRNDSEFRAAVQTGFSGAITANFFSGNGGGLIHLNASQLSSGVIPLAQLPAAVVTNNQSNVTLNGTFSGQGSGLTNLNPANLSAGTAGINISGNAATAATAANLIVGGNIDIGIDGAPGDNSIIRIGTQGFQTNTFMAGIYGATAASGVGVYVNSSGQLGTLTSSRKYKQDLRSMGDASGALLALQPVTFRYQPDLDPAGLLQFGLVAEDVEKVNPDLVAHDDQGRPYTVRHQAVAAMLLNEFLKEHRKVEAQTAKIDELTQRLDRLEKIISQAADQR